MRGTRVVAVLLVSCAILGTLVSPAFAKRTLGLSSGTFKLKAKSGESVGGVVYVTNDGDERINVLVYAADQTVDETGGITYSAPNRADLSAMDSPATWTRITMPAESQSLGNIPYLVMDPGDRIPVKFSVNVPQGVAPGDHDLVIFFEMFDRPQAGSSRALVAGRIGARVTLRVAGTVSRGLEVRPFEVPGWVLGPKVTYSFLIRNRGNVNERVTASTMLLDRNGQELVTATPVPAQTVYAGENLEGRGHFIGSGAPFGPHSVRLEVVPVDDEGVELDAGKDRIVLERDVWFIPWWVLVVGVLLVVMLLGALTRSASATRKRRREDLSERRRRRSARAGASATDHESEHEREEPRV